MRVRARSARPPYGDSRSRPRTRRPGSGLQLAIADLRRRGTESRAPRPDRPQPLREPRPRPGLDLAVAHVALPARRLEVLEPRVRLFDHQQLFRLALRHVGPPCAVLACGSLPMGPIVGPASDGASRLRRATASLCSPPYGACRERGPDTRRERRRYRWYLESRHLPMLCDIDIQRARHGALLSRGGRPAVARSTEGDPACRGSVVGSNPTPTGPTRAGLEGRRRPSRPPLPSPQPTP